MKQKLAWLLFMGAVGLLVWAAPDDGIVEPVARVATVAPADIRERGLAPHATHAATDEGSLTVLARTPEPPESTLFSSHSWVPPAPAARSVPVQAVVTAPLAPVLPPLPFRLVGRLEQEHGTVFLLERDGRSLMASVGDTLDGSYRIEHEDATALTFRFLPMDQLQTLPLPSKP
jgi:hypothetical protein